MGASKRGCFIYGNVMDTVNEQVQNQLYCSLIALNTPHFDYPSCLFSREHMTRIDPGDMKKGLTAEGSGRVATYLSHGIIHSYTLECNYNTSKFANEVPETVGHPQGQTQDYPLSAPANNNPEKYTPSSYHGVGRACVLAMLDIRGINPCSRIPNSKWQSLEKLRAAILKEVGLRKEYRAFRAKQRAASVNNIGRREGKGGGNTKADRDDKGVVFDGASGVSWKARTCAYEKERSNSAPKPSETITPSSLIPPAQLSNRLPVSHSLHSNTHVPIAISEGHKNIHSDDYIKNHVMGDGEKSVPPKTFFRGASASHHNHMDRHLNDLISCTENAAVEPVAAVGILQGNNNNPNSSVSKFAKTMRATMTEKYSSSSKLPPKIPNPKTSVDNANTKPSSRQSLLPYPLSHQSTLSQAGKRAFGKSGSPSDGGGSLSTNIVVGITEDLSRLTKPSLGIPMI